MRGHRDGRAAWRVLHGPDRAVVEVVLVEDGGDILAHLLEVHRDLRRERSHGPEAEAESRGSGHAAGGELEACGPGKDGPCHLGMRPSPRWRCRAERSRALQQKLSAACMPLECARTSAAAALAVAAASAAAVEFCCLPGSHWPGFYQQDAHLPQRHGRQWRMHGEQQHLDTRWLSGCRFPGAQKTCSPWHCVLRPLARVTRAGGGYDVKVRRELSRDNMHAGSRVATAHAPLGRRATERRKERANVIVVAFEKSSRPWSQLK